MAQEYFMVFARPIEGKDDELVAWWDRSHIPDVLSVDGFSSAKRLKGAEGAPFPYCLIYEVVEGEEEAARALLQEAMGKFGHPRLHSTSTQSSLGSSPSPRNTRQSPDPKGRSPCPSSSISTAGPSPS